jgi:hypothetical protein
MTKMITALLLLVYSTLFGQTAYEQGMQNALGLWSEGKTEESVALFERIAAAEKDNWLPNYYVALVNTTTAFNTPDKIQMNALLNKAQSALDVEVNKQPNHPELLVMQAMIHTAWIVFDPSTNGMKLSGKVMELYAKAETIAPENPRVVLSKTEFEMGSARYFGTDVKPLCAKVEKAIELFASFKPETAFHPNWGLDRAQGILADCE